MRTVKSVRQKVSSLSGGQRQTVAIARAVLKKAKVVILDEPTAALGVAQTEQVLNLVKRLAEQGVAVIIISHNLADVFEVADYINVLYLGTDGRAARDEEHHPRRRRRLHHRHQDQGPGRSWKASDMTDIRTDPDPDAAAAAVEAIGSGHEGSLGDQFQAYFQRVRAGEMGALPALAGLLVLSLLFTFLSPFFLTERNFANLLTQAATLVMLGMALVFLLLLARSTCPPASRAASAMALFILLLNDQHWNWIVALVVALLAGVLIGSFIGFFVARVGIPSFVVTLGLFLAFQGLMLVLLGAAGSYRIEIPPSWPS